MRAPTITHILALALFCACPIPIPRDTVTRPAIDFVVHDATGTPIPNARVLLLTASDPHSRVEGIEEIATDAEGRAAFTERIENITQYPLMMHGVAFYYWWWCVEIPHATETSSAVVGRPAPRVDVVFTPEAEGRHCVERHGDMAAERNPPRAGTRVHFRLAAGVTRSLEDVAEGMADDLGARSVNLPKSFAFDVRVESEQMVVDLGGLDAKQEQELLAGVTKFSDAELIGTAPFGK